MMNLTDLIVQVLVLGSLGLGAGLLGGIIGGFVLFIALPECLQSYWESIHW